MKPGRDLTWDQLLATGDMAGGAALIEPTEAEDPLIAIYTSGTTGRPKGILHTHCGFPVKSAQDMCFGTDVGQGTRISWMTDVGWMMGPWLIYGALILGSTIVLYDGAPDFRSRIGCGSSARDTRSRFWAFRRRSYAHWRRRAINGLENMISHRCASSARLANPGIPIRGGGCLKTSGGGAYRSSTILAELKSQAES